MPAKQPSAAVLNARQRRTTRAASDEVRWEWFLRNVSDKIQMTLRQRVQLATRHLRDKVVQNLSQPVTVGTGPMGGRVVTDRSVAGEFPKADLTNLMKGIFDEVKLVGTGLVDGFVGTPTDYGLILETKMDRSFLVRTMNEQAGTITRIMTGPIV